MIVSFYQAKVPMFHPKQNKHIPIDTDLGVDRYSVATLRIMNFQPYISDDRTQLVNFLKFYLLLLKLNSECKK